MTRTIMQSRRAFELARLLLLTFCILMLTQRPSYGVVLAVDFDGGGGPTQSGFVGLPVGTTAAGSSVTVEGVTFTVLAADGSSDLSGPDDLLRDFVYSEALFPRVGISVSGLMPGQWKLDVWSSIDLLSGGEGDANTILYTSGAYQTSNASNPFIADPTQPYRFQLYGGVTDSLALPSDFSLFVQTVPTQPSCDSAIMTCPGGFVINKDPANGCAFCPCPAPGTTPETCPSSTPVALPRYQMRLKALMLTSVAIDPLEPNPTPEPPTLVLVALGLAMAGFVFVRRRRT